MTLIDKALKILEKTNDGNDLTPQHLKLIENGVNGFLNDKGVELLDELYKAVEAGQYKPPAYLNVDFMVRDLDGFVFFKGQQVEHYSSFYANTELARQDLKVLQSKCLFLESRNIPINRHFQCDYSMGGSYAEPYCLSQKSQLDNLSDGKALQFTFVKLSCDDFVMPGHILPHDVINSKIYNQICGYRGGDKIDFTLVHCEYGDTENGLREATPDEAVLLFSAYDYLKDKEFIKEKAKMTATFENERNFTADETLDNECEDEEDCEI